MVTRDPVRPAQPPMVSLPALRPYGGGPLAVEGDYDGLAFEDLDLSGGDAAGARFLDCALRRCALDTVQLELARIVDSVLTEVRGVGTSLASARLRDVEVRDARLGGARLSGAVLNRVLVRGGKFDYMNLRQAQLTDVAFVDCVLVEPDFTGARLERVSFAGCEVRGADFTKVAMAHVDLREVGRLEISRGADRLAGAVITSTQLLELAPLFAAQLGVRVENG